MSSRLDSKWWKNAPFDVPAVARIWSTEVPDAKELADHLFATFEGGYLLCRSLGSPEPMRAQLRVYRQLVQSLLGR